MTDRISAYNQAIADVKAAQRDYAKLEVLWYNVTKDRFANAISARYKEAGLSADQVLKMVEAETKAFRASPNADQFRAHLDELHDQSVAAAVKQLEYERDNPDSASQPAPDEQPAGNQALDTIGTYALAVVAWLGNSFASNIQAAGNEPGVGAQVLRGSLGISVADIQKYGILGGDNSYLRKIIPTWSDGGGVFGGSNSFFRKPFG